MLPCRGGRADRRGAFQMDDQPLSSALSQARDTRLLIIERNARYEVPKVVVDLFGTANCVLIADSNTFAAAGKDVYDAFRRSGGNVVEPIVLDAHGLYAEYAHVEQLQEALRVNDAIPIAVGSGTINDLTKLASHLCGRSYLCVATAASMDGYTAFGASITRDGSKQTFDCPAPAGVVADLDVIAHAPEELSASGYGDLIAKCPAGADWILADALGIDPIEQAIWDMVQSRLRHWLSDPAGIAKGDLTAIRQLTVALMSTGFAMQAACSSRPVSGAEHQFSHLWDMEHHKYHGVTPSHGFKVAIGSLASASMYESLMSSDIANLGIDAAVDAWPDATTSEREIAALFPSPELRSKALIETRKKYIDRDELRAQLQLLKARWPTIQQRLTSQLIPQLEMRDMLRAAGCPTQPEQIGISAVRLRDSHRKALHIRRRFTILDLLQRAGILEQALNASTR